MPSIAIYEKLVAYVNKQEVGVTKSLDCRVDVMITLEYLENL
jgi:hypothetical protein